MATPERTQFVAELLKSDLSRTWFLTADIGYGVLEPVQDALKERFLNMGCREQLMVAAAAGIASRNWRVFCYSFRPFLALKAIEQIRNEVMAYPRPLDVCLVGCSSPAGGLTHSCQEDKDLLKDYIDVMWGKDLGGVRPWRDAVKSKIPRYLILE